MAAHAALIRPRFECVLETLERNWVLPEWAVGLSPRGGYFISFNTLPGLAREVVALADAIGVKLTPAGATYPYGEGSTGQQYRLSPTYPSLADITAAVTAFVVCVKIASLNTRLQQGASQI